MKSRLRITSPKSSNDNGYRGGYKGD